MGKRTSPITDPETLRAIAHPVRLRLYETLVVAGPATAARLARHVPGAPGSLSYHLRQLAESGFVEEAPELGTDGRERWWRAVPGGVRWSDDDLENRPGAAEVATAAQSALLGRQLDRIRTWIRDGHRRWGPRWRSAAVNIDTVLHLSPGELDQLHAELDAVLDQWRSHSDRRGTDDESRESVFLSMHAFPFEARAATKDPAATSNDEETP